MKKLFCLITIIACLLVSTAYAATPVASGNLNDKISWALDANGTLTIEGSGDMPEISYNTISWYEYKDSIKYVEIKNGITSIGKYAFDNCYSLKSISIPESVTNIGDYAFSACESLAEIILPSSLDTMGYRSFDGCTSISSIYIPERVTNVGEYPFVDCKNLSNISVSENNNHYSSLDGVLFDKNRNTLLRYPIGKQQTTYTIPESVTCIGNQAFGSGAYNPDTGENVKGTCPLEHIEFPKNLTTIKNSAFSGCQNLESVSLPDTLHTIESSAFIRCTELKNITLPNNIATINNRTFYYCTSLSSIIIPANISTIGQYAFSYSGLTKITIPSDIVVDSYGFYLCSKLTDVFIVGSEESWQNNHINTVGNSTLLNASIHFMPYVADFSYEKQDSEAQVHLSVGNLQELANIYIATYDENGRLLEIRTPTLVNNSTKTTFILKNAYKIKAFIWNSLLQPITSCAEIVL